MSTTALFIELLITGLQATMWLTLFILCFLGFDWINPERLKGFEALFAMLLLPIIYPVGVFIDYLADRLFHPWEKKMRATYNLNKDQTALRLLMETKDPALLAHFNYIRSRIRICRASALNFILITISGTLFTLVRCWNIPRFPFWRALLLEFAIGAFLSVLAVFAWRYINHSFFKWVIRGYDTSIDISGTGTIEEAVLAASLAESTKS